MKKQKVILKEIYSITIFIILTLEIEMIYYRIWFSLRFSKDQNSIVNFYFLIPVMAEAALKVLSLLLYLWSF